MDNGGNGVGTGGVFWVPGFGGCVVNAKGYPRIASGPLRGQYLHRAVWESVAGRPLPKGWQVHHMNGKLDWAPGSLLALEPCLHVSAERRRDPYTGEFLSEEQWRKRYYSPIAGNA
jgi:HNH endonuclease